MYGDSSSTMITESPISISAWAIVPSGPGKRMRSVAPKISARVGLVSHVVLPSCWFLLNTRSNQGRMRHPTGAYRRGQPEPVRSPGPGELMDLEQPIGAHDGRVKSGASLGKLAHLTRRNG